MKKIKPLTSVIFETTNICNLSCAMCPVNNDMKRQKVIMDLGLFKKIIDDNPQLERVVLHNWGEPLLNPCIFEMIDHVPETVKEVLMTTNTTLFNDEIIDNLVKSNLTRIQFSIDSVGREFEKIRGFSYEEVKSNILKFIEANNKSGMKVWIVIVINEKTENSVEAVKKEWAHLVDRVHFQPQLLIKNKRTAPCNCLWGRRYGELIVLSNGTIVPCCCDYEGILKLGDANTERLIDIWNSEKMKTLRELHEKGQFPELCSNCNEYETVLAEKRF
ncbi:MAG: SPASM domain-containing protein [Candidatus Aenigmarchaeota archaeon]|nr:SPASM domain-containing protein [Candidatus Aenigmarchaeota archaeon]